MCAHDPCVPAQLKEIEDKMAEERLRAAAQAEEQRAAFAAKEAELAARMEGAWGAPRLHGAQCACSLIARARVVACVFCVCLRA